MLQKQYWKEAQLSAHQQPSTRPTWGEVQQYVAWGKASHRDYKLIRVDLCYLDVDQMLALISVGDSVE